MPRRWHLSVTDPRTLKTYAEKAGEYADLTTDSTVKDPMFHRFVEEIPKGGHVLDLGCGPGHYAALMAQAGLKVTATDAVPEMVALAAEQPGVTALCATFDDIKGDDLYDGIWANFSLLHAPRADMPRHLAALKLALKSDGLFHIGLKTGTGSKRDTINRLYTYYTYPELENMLTETGFNVIHHTTGTDKGLDGVQAEWVAVHARG